MDIIKISPQGFCNGVNLALKKVNDALNNPNTKKPIYLLGMIIHNKFVCDELVEKGIIILEGNNRSELIDNIDTGTVIISAHGINKAIKDKIINKGLNLIDATCPIVNNIHEKIFKYLNLGYEILYIGKQNHPESIGVLNESNKIHLIDNIDKLNNINKDKKYYVTNQTTLSNDYIIDFHNKIKELFKNVVIENDICLATTKREMALYDIKSDLIIVVGDPKSSNTNKLVDIAKRKASAKNVIFIQSAKDLIDFDFSIYHKIHITSGASTPKELTEQVIRYIINKDNNILQEKLFFI